MQRINNLRVSAFESILSPQEAAKKVPVTKKARATVLKARKEIQDILNGKDKRKILIVGPCSIHDKKSALEYAKRLNDLRTKSSHKYVIVMRVYFEKPRTTVGWKGFVYDPNLNGKYGLQKGVIQARDILVKINEMGLPTATEVLGPVVIQYYSDLICWSAIGARTSESQTHRELASGLSMPVGFKNGTEGNVDIAINAILSAHGKHSFLGMDDFGKVAVVKTKGNPDGHLILRGGKDGPNYSAKHVAQVEKHCEKAGIVARLIIDASHANSDKDFKKQSLVFKDVIRQIAMGNQSIKGLMLESNLHEGAQKIPANLSKLKYGISITDGCISWEETENLIMESL